MPRVARIVVPGCPHHVTQRGNNRQDIFFVDDDRRVYLEILAEQAKRFGLKIEAYCLMTNHVHLIATPAGAQSLAKAVGRTDFHYTRYVNSLHGRSGHLWQNRFFSCALDNEHFWSALVYVERNPVRARLVRRAWRWPWSSAAAHCGGPDKNNAAGTEGLLDLDNWRKRISIEQWRESLAEVEDEQTVERLRRWTHRGRPLGSDGFLSKLERTFGRRLRALPIGRPRGKRKVRK